ncbi:MAG: DUF2924 domain-containing protein [Sedimentisphaeraceae bacterium JB056]
MMAIERQKEKLKDLSLSELRTEYEKVFGEITTSRHRHYIIKRLLWKIQANEQGDLSARALVRAAKLADFSQIRLTEPKSKSQTIKKPINFNLSLQKEEDSCGFQLERIYKGKRIVVTMTDNGVRFNGKLYRSLSAVAKEVTGTHTSGKAFFGLTKRKAN